MPQPSAACKRALADATALCPKRSRIADGLMGDAAHQKGKVTTMTATRLT
jgi:hypothetical protein